MEAAVGDCCPKVAPDMTEGSPWAFGYAAAPLVTVSVYSALPLSLGRDQALTVSPTRSRYHGTQRRRSSNLWESSLNEQEPSDGPFVCQR